MTASPQGLFTSSLPELYERFLVAPLFRPFAQDLLDRAGLTENDWVLDVACGTGIVARLAQETVRDRGRVVGIDASRAMLAMARGVAPAIDWREGDAARLPVGNEETFDLVACHQGLQFFGDKPAALREMRRVLAPRGRVALGVWRAVGEIPLIRDLQRAAEPHLHQVVDQRHSLGDPEAIRHLLVEAGFDAVHVVTVTYTIRMSEGAVFSRLNAMALVGMSPAAKAMTDDQRAQMITAIANDSATAIQPYLDGTDLVFNLVSNVATARPATRGSGGS
jgi:ubiquinone/menaquinone biosynthesis C-methylase UbiE